MIFKKILIFFGIIFFLVSCETPRGIFLRETPLNISETRKVIVKVIGTPRLISENGRELYSAYFDKTGSYTGNFEALPERRFTQVIIYGDRRPYDILVNVIIETKVRDQKFQINGYDDEKAKSITDRIKAALHQSHDSRNVIDDFKPM